MTDSQADAMAPDAIPWRRARLLLVLGLAGMVLTFILGASLGHELACSAEVPL
jgi:hypothetical protein